MNGYIMTPVQRFAMRLRQLREARGMTQEQLAKRARLSRVYITKLETRKQDPRLGIVVKLAKALNVKVGELVD
jgi:transcriptional regulator with XRE-family HTH domain